jgi:hypothetical protein
MFHEILKKQKEKGVFRERTSFKGDTCLSIEASDALIEERQNLFAVRIQLFAD